MFFQKKVFWPRPNDYTQIGPICCCNAVVGIPWAKLIILLFQNHAFSSEIHFCNTSNVLASFFEGGSPLGASLGGLFFHENHIISLVLCVFALQASVLWNCFKNVCIYVFHINLALKCLILHVYMAIFCLPHEVADFTDVTLTKVKAMILENVYFHDFHNIFTRNSIYSGGLLKPLGGLWGVTRGALGSVLGLS